MLSLERALDRVCAGLVRRQRNLLEVVVFLFCRVHCYRAQRVGRASLRVLLPELCTPRHGCFAVGHSVAGYLTSFIPTTAYYCEGVSPGTGATQESKVRTWRQPFQVLPEPFLTTKSRAFLAFLAFLPSFAIRAFIGGLISVATLQLGAGGPTWIGWLGIASQAYSLDFPQPLSSVARRGTTFNLREVRKRTSRCRDIATGGEATSRQSAAE